MLTPTHALYFIVCRPEQVNGRLAAHDGKLLLNLPNYTELLTEAPVVTDGALQVFEIEISLDQVKVQQNGSRTEHLVWAGERHSRSRPGELVSVQVRSLVEFVSRGVTHNTPAQIAGMTFAGYPPNVQLSATILTVDDATLVAAGMSPDIRKWAHAQVSLGGGQLSANG